MFIFSVYGSLTYLTIMQSAYSLFRYHVFRVCLCYIRPRYLINDTISIEEGSFIRLYASRKLIIQLGEWGVGCIIFSLSLISPRKWQGYV